MEVVHLFIFYALYYFFIIYSEWKNVLTTRFTGKLIDGTLLGLWKSVLCLAMLGLAVSFSICYQLISIHTN